MTILHLEKSAKSNWDLAQKLFTLNEPKPISDLVLERRDIHKRSFKQFCIDFWPYAGAGRNRLEAGITLDALSHALPALYAGHFKMLLFSAAAREGKSTIICVLWTVYLWTLDPTLTMLTTSYSHGLATRDNVFMQRLIESDLFQAIYGDLFKLLITNSERTFNSRGGQRVATSILGKNTGAGGIWIIGDDCNSLTDRKSEVKGEKTNDVIENVLINRQDDASRTRFIFGQHRNSPFDCIARLLSKEDPDVVYLPVPMEFEIKKRSVLISCLTNEIIWQDPRTQEGELLSPTRTPRKEVERLKLYMGKREYQAIYQCNPQTNESCVFPSEWFKIWQAPFYPRFKEIIQSWDTALSTGVQSCFSACTNWGVFEDDLGHTNLMFINMWSGKKEWTELRHMALRMAKNYNDIQYDNPKDGFDRPSKILIEAKANGLSLAQSLKKAGVENIIPYTPRQRGGAHTEDAKTIRARIMSPFVESGRVWVMPAFPDMESANPLAQRFIQACEMFPSSIADTRDIVDTFTMSLEYLQRKGQIQTLEEIMKNTRMPRGSLYH